MPSHLLSKPFRSKQLFLSLVHQLAVTTSIICFAGFAFAAEITIGQTVVLEGLIEPGDYDKLRDFLLAKRDYGIFGDPTCDGPYLDGCPDEIYLASPGGDAAEAMKIGRLVRSLGWETMAPSRTLNDAIGDKLRQTQIERYGLEDPQSNFM
jgi:hypothetical protein